MDKTPFIDAYQEINTRLIRLVGSMSALRELSSLELSLCDEAELLKESLRIMMENHELDYVVVYLNQDGELVQHESLQWGEAHSDARLEKLSPMLDDMAEHVIDSGSTLYEREVDVVEAQTGSMMCLPIISGINRLGVLCAYYPDVDYFTQAHERSLLIFCNFLAQSLMNNRLLHKMDSLVRERTGQLQDALLEARELKQRYEELAVIDELTSLHNRRFFFPEAHTALSSAVRYEKDLSIMMIDIDYFKRINDVHGHSMGDQVLKGLASLLEKEKREADILARFGGEEFIMLLPETDAPGAVIFAERIRKRIEKMVWEVDGTEVRGTASFGISSLLLPEDKNPPELLEKLIKQADEALYHSKEHGRNRVSCYSELQGITRQA